MKRAICFLLTFLFVISLTACAGTKQTQPESELDIDVDSVTQLIKENLGGAVTLSLAEWKKWCYTESYNLSEEEKNKFLETYIRIEGYLVYETGENKGKLYLSEQAVTENQFDYISVLFDDNYLPEQGGLVVVAGKPVSVVDDSLTDAQIIQDSESEPESRIEITFTELLEASFDDMSMVRSYVEYNTGIKEYSINCLLKEGYNAEDAGCRVKAAMMLMDEIGVSEYTITIAAEDAEKLGTISVINGEIESQTDVSSDILQNIENASSEKVEDEMQKINEQWNSIH